MKDNYDFSDLDAILAEFSSKGDPEAEAELLAMTVPEPAPAEPVHPDTEPGRVDLEDVLIDEELARPDENGAVSVAQSAPASDIAEPLPAPELPPCIRARAAPKPRSLFHRAPAGSPCAAPRRGPPRSPGAAEALGEESARRGPQGVRAGAVGSLCAAQKVRAPARAAHPAGACFPVSLRRRAVLDGLQPPPRIHHRGLWGGDARLRLADKLDVYVNNAASDALGDLAYIKKIYTLQESDTVAPAPDPNGFGITDDLDEVQAVIEKAAVVLDGQELIFRPDVEFVPGAPFRYYLDDTIFVLTWQEYIERRCCTFAEVKIAHGSQVRRKIAGDSYSSGVQLYASTMANAANAVVAINGDFYEYRNLGITVYQRTLYRNNPATVDTCFFTASGDMLFSRAGELMGEGEAQRFIDDNDVVFAIAFGPVLVDNGELQEITSYPIGEINTMYSRSCISMKGELHYLLMNINWDGDRPRATIPELGRYVYSKGVDKSYTLDGGQTSEIVMMGGPINHVDFGSERSVSDIIYFATAIPEEVRS